MHERKLQNKIKMATGLMMASLALTACNTSTGESLSPRPNPSESTYIPSPTPTPIKTHETIQVKLPLDKRCYTIGKVACVDLQKPPGIEGTLYAMDNGKVQFKVPVRSGSTNHTDGTVGIYTPRCETSIHYKSPVVYSNLFSYPVPMYNAMSVGCDGHNGVFIHGSLEFDQLGYGSKGYDGKPYGSHGCINVHYADGDSKRVYDFFDVGDRAVVYDPSTEQIGFKNIVVKN
jgi:hypothetical protein